MDIHLEPDVLAKLDHLAKESGRPASELIHDAITGYVDDLIGLRQMLDTRYDEVKSGKVIPMNGPEAFARLRQNISR